MVVHIGNGPNHGHYVCCARAHGHWLLFDDDEVVPIDETTIQSLFGLFEQRDALRSTETAYILFYRARAKPSTDAMLAEEAALAEPRPTTLDATGRA